MLLRFDPFRELDRAAQSLSWPSTAPALPMDAVRRGDEVIASFDLPGVDKDAIDLTVERNVLTVSAERRPDRTEEDQPIATERRYGRFSRQVFLGDTLDTEHIEADYDQGVLRLRIPVAPTAKPKKVSVGGDGAAEAISTTASDSHADANGN